MKIKVANCEISGRTTTLYLPEDEQELANKLAQIHIGNTLEKNCMVVDIKDDGGGLQCLVGQHVNADELQYLSKLMDGFDSHELQSFYAIVEANRLTEVKDLINLSFNLHCYTVVTDFHSLEEIGRLHLINLQDGFDPQSLTTVDYSKIARDLIKSGGEITSYGIVYPNGQPIDMIYNGQQFPEYFYKDCQASIRLTLTSEPEKTETLYLPCWDVEIQKALLRLGASSLNECTLELGTSEINNAVRGVFETENKLSECLADLNRLAWCYQTFETKDIDKFLTVFNFTDSKTPQDVVRLAEQLDEFVVYPEIKSVEEYGRYVVEDLEQVEFDPNLRNYIDFKSIGEGRIQQENGVFTERGYIAYLGTDPLMQALMSRGDASEISMGHAL